MCHYSWRACEREWQSWTLTKTEKDGLLMLVLKQGETCSAIMNHCKQHKSKVFLGKNVIFWFDLSG